MVRLMETDGHGEVADRVRARRNGRLRPIDRMLLHSPQIADGWNSLLGAIRQRTDLPADVRELIILRIAVLNRADYEWDSHERDARDAGLSDQIFAALREPDYASSNALSPLQKRILDLTDCMTKEVFVPDSIFDPLRSDFADPQLLEVVTTIAAYNMVSRFAVALDVSIVEVGA